VATASTEFTDHISCRREQGNGNFKKAMDSPQGAKSYFLAMQLLQHGSRRMTPQGINKFIFGFIINQMMA
jgi:hypothetical protein